MGWWWWWWWTRESGVVWTWHAVFTVHSRGFNTTGLCGPKSCGDVVSPCLPFSTKSNWMVGITCQPLCCQGRCPRYPMLRRYVRCEGRSECYGRVHVCLQSNPHSSFVQYLVLSLPWLSDCLTYFKVLFPRFDLRNWRKPWGISIRLISEENSKIVPTHSMKTCTENRVVAPLILKLSIRRRWVRNVVS